MAIHAVNVSYHNQQIKQMAPVVRQMTGITHVQQIHISTGCGKVNENTGRRRERKPTGIGTVPIASQSVLYPSDAGA